VLILAFAGIMTVTFIPMTPLGRALNLAALPGVYFAYLAAIIAGYMTLATTVKKLYVHRYGELL
jgi:Mg2+-importing ATPase